MSLLHLEESCSELICALEVYISTQDSIAIVQTFPPNLEARRLNFALVLWPGNVNYHLSVIHSSKTFEESH